MPHPTRNFPRPLIPPSLLFMLFMALSSAAQAADWQMAKGPLATRWAKDVTADKALPEYPRPQMVRESWQNLNGLWDYAVRPKGEDRPVQFDGKILVPFPIESALSGVMKRVDEPNRLWYRRHVSIEQAVERAAAVAPFRSRQLSVVGLGQRAVAGRASRRLR